MTENLPDIPTSYERMVVLIGFLGIAGYYAYNGKIDAAAGFITAIVTYFLSRNGA